MGLLHFIEIFGGSSLQNFLLNEVYEKTLIRKLQFNFDIQYSKKNLTKIIDKYDFEVHETNFKTEISQMNLKFPLTTFYEQSS
jgi:UDP-3-O-acyl-N-acetylglucosamine deacetylase